MWIKQSAFMQVIWTQYNILKWDSDLDTFIARRKQPHLGKRWDTFLVAKIHGTWKGDVRKNVTDRRAHL